MGKQLSWNNSFTMIKLTLFAILLLATQDVYGRCNGDKWCCKGQCGQGEGDCDKDSNCLPGLKCDFDGWFGTDYCVAGPDTKNFDWSEWSDWSECSVACGGVGTQSRSRSCIPPQNGGFSCPSDTDSETQECDNGPCPVNGGWGDWSDWDDCPVPCGGADQSRTRVCDNPAPQFGGVDCTVDGSTDAQTQRCNENPCPIDGGFSAWDEWGPCTVECGGGDQTRSRRCDSPPPRFGGADCVGELFECQRCNMEPCSSHCPV